MDDRLIVHHIKYDFLVLANFDNIIIVCSIIDDVFNVIAYFLK